MDPEALHRRLDPLQHLRHRIVRQPRQLGDVGAVVAVLRRLLATAPGLDRRAEPLHLRAGVVVVVLALDLVAGEGEQARDRVAVGAVARGRDRDRAGRVRGDHLDLDPLLRLGRAAAVLHAGREHLRERVAVPVARQPEVDEAGAGDLGPLDLRQRRRLLDELLRDRPRRLPARAGELHRHVRRVVAVRVVARPLEHDGRARRLAERRLQRFDRSHAVTVRTWTRTIPARSGSSTSRSTRSTSPARTRTSRTSPSRTTSSRSPSRGSTTRSPRATCPGIVVSRVNMSTRFAKELLDALQDSWSKYATVRGIQDLPEAPPRNS